MKHYTSVFILLVLFFALFLIVNPSYIGFAVYTPATPDLELELEKVNYLPNETVEGELRILFSGPIKEKTITVEFGDFILEKDLTLILAELNKDYLRTESILKAANPVTQKSLTFSSAGSKEIAFKIPKNSEILSVNMDIAGLSTADSYPEFPFVDILKDENLDWQYFGSLVSFDEEFVYASGLDESYEGDKILLSTWDDLYCELIDLPYSKNFKVSVKYTKENEGVIKASILDYIVQADNVYAVEELGTCNLPSSPVEEWPSCNLVLDRPVERNYLVCISTEGDGTTTYYRLSTESVQPATGYKCDNVGLVDESKGLCFETNSDYFIRVNKAEYSKILDTGTKFSQHQVLDTLYMKDYISEYLSECVADESGYCAVPVEIGSSSQGILYLGSLEIKYSGAAGRAVSNNFYDLESDPAVFYEIEGEELANYTLIIPLSMFEILVPEPEDEFESKILKIKLDSITKTEDINIYKTEIPEEVTSEEFLISNTKDLLNNLLEGEREEIVNKFGLDIQSAVASLDNYKLELDNIIASDLTDLEKEEQIEELKSTIESFREDLPKYIIIKEKVADTPLLPSEISDEMILENQRTKELKERIFRLQNQVDIMSDATVFDLVKFSGETEEKTLIKRKVTSSLADSYLVESIPKSLVSSTSEIIGDFDVVDDDPIIRWYLRRVAGEVSYILSGNIIPYLSEIKTLIVPKTIAFPGYDVVCGDGICTIPLEDEIVCPQDCAKRIPWLFLAVLFFVLLIGIYYINFYRGKFALKKVEKKKPLFKSKIDELNLINYVKKSLSEKISKERIIRILLSKGWTEEQINYAFRKIERK